MKKPFIIYGSIVLLMVIIIVISIFVIYKNNQFSIRTSECKKTCDYNPTAKIWKYTQPTPTTQTSEIMKKYGGTILPETKLFQTQEQCLDYCLTR